MLIFFTSSAHETGCDGVGGCDPSLFQSLCPSVTVTLHVVDGGKCRDRYSAL